jgi:hypothetical protein
MIGTTIEKSTAGVIAVKIFSMRQCNPAWDLEQEFGILDGNFSVF